MNVHEEEIPENINTDIPVIEQEDNINIENQETTEKEPIQQQPIEQVPLEMEITDSTNKSIPEIFFEKEEDIKVEEQGLSEEELKRQEEIEELKALALVRTREATEKKLEGNKLNTAKDHTTEEDMANLRKSLEIYNEGVRLIDPVMNELVRYGLRDDKLYHNLLTEKRNLYSNIALAYQRLRNIDEALRYNNLIIDDIDRTFSKSYARMIQLYVEKGDIDKATSMYHRMCSTFNEKVMSEYKDYVSILENAIKKQQESFKSFSGYAKKPNKRDEVVEPNKAVAKKTKNKWFTFVFGSFLTIMGVGTLYFIFKNKNKFSI
jgi:pentatricopeptide repeat protein